MEARSHDAVHQRIGEGDDRHSLVVGHVGAYDRNGLADGQTSGRVVERLVVAVAAVAAGRREPHEIPGGCERIDHRRERRRVRRDNRVCGQASFQSKPWHAEARILVGEFQVARVVRGFRHAPGYVQFVAVGLVAPDDQAVRLLEEAADRGAHDERRHQVLEHRAGPRDEGGAARDRGQRPAEPEPVTCRQIPIGNRHQA